MKKECVCPKCGKPALRKYWGGRTEYVHSGGFVCWSDKKSKKKKEVKKKIE